MERGKEITIQLTEEVAEGPKKCPCCNWESSAFYYFGETVEKAREQFKLIFKYEDEGDGKGLCPGCVTEWIFDCKPTMVFPVIEKKKEDG